MIIISLFVDAGLSMGGAQHSSVVTCIGLLESTNPSNCVSLGDSASLFCWLLGLLTLLTCFVNSNDVAAALPAVFCSTNNDLI